MLLTVECNCHKLLTLDSPRCITGIWAQNCALFSIDFARVTCVTRINCWLRGTVVERRSLAGELSLSCTRPLADR